METLEIKPFCPIAVELFLKTILKMWLNPMFLEALINKDWENAYEALKIGGDKIPDVIRTYNEAFIFVTENKLP